MRGLLDTWKVLGLGDFLTDQITEVFRLPEDSGKVLHVEKSRWKSQIHSQIRKVTNIKSTANVRLASFLTL